MSSFGQAGQGTQGENILYSIYLFSMCSTVLSKSRHSQVQALSKPFRVCITDAAGNEDSHLTPAAVLRTNTLSIG